MNSAIEVECACRVKRSDGMCVVSVKLLILLGSAGFGCGPLVAVWVPGAILNDVYNAGVIYKSERLPLFYRDGVRLEAIFFQVNSRGG